MKHPTPFIFLALTTLVMASACEGGRRYPNCKAFEFGNLSRPPELIDDSVTPEDCGTVRVFDEGTETPMVEGATALDCAIDHIVAGTAMQIELHENPGYPWSRTSVIYTDDDGTAMRYVSKQEDLSGFVEARTYQLDTARVEGCKEIADVSERIGCLHDAIDASELISTCQTKLLGSD